MKKTIRLIAILMIAAIAAICMVSCGAEDKVKGDWTVKTIGGKTPAEVAAAAGVPEYVYAINYTVTSDEFKATSMTVDGKENTTTMKVKMRSNGFECYDGDTLVMSVIYNESDDTLSFGVKTNGVQMDYVLKKGKADQNALKEAAAKPAESAAENAEQKPAENAEQPAENAEQPAENAEQPAENAEQPAENAEQPAENAEQPAENAEQPAENAEQPAEGGEQAAE